MKKIINTSLFIANPVYNVRFILKFLIIDNLTCSFTVLFLVVHDNFFIFFTDYKLIKVNKKTNVKFYFSHITLPGEYTVAGAQALYERDNELEKIRIPGPIQEPIVVYVSYLAFLIYIIVPHRTFPQGRPQIH